MAECEWGGSARARAQLRRVDLGALVPLRTRPPPPRLFAPASQKVLGRSRSPLPPEFFSPPAVRARDRRGARRGKAMLAVWGGPPCYSSLQPCGACTVTRRGPSRCWSWSLTAGKPFPCAGRSVGSPEALRVVFREMDGFYPPSPPCVMAWEQLCSVRNTALVLYLRESLRVCEQADKEKNQLPMQY